MIEHTPGPWEVLDADSYAGQPAIVVAAAEATGGRLVCLCSQWQYGTHMPYTATDDANARLIAAAPDLEYELGGIADLLNDGEIVRIEPGSVKALRIMAAIDKATNPKEVKGSSNGNRQTN